MEAYAGFQAGNRSRPPSTRRYAPSISSFGRPGRSRPNSHEESSTWAVLWFRRPDENSRQIRNEIGALSPELVFRGVPGNLPQHSRPRRFRHAPARGARRLTGLEPPRASITRVAFAPRRLRLRSPRCLARGLAARALARPYARVGYEPAVALAARPLLRYAARLAAVTGMESRRPAVDAPGLDLPSRGGPILTSVEDHGRRSVDLRSAYDAEGRHRPVLPLSEIDAQPLCSPRSEPRRRRSSPVAT